jgi:transposase
LTHPNSKFNYTYVVKIQYKELGVIKMEDWVSIRNIRAKNPKLGTRKIAKLLGISRNTVKKVLASDNAPKYKGTTTAINEHVLPFEKFIKEAFLIKKLKASRILKDIISKGYKGSQYALYAYIRNELKPLQDDISRNNPTAYKSYETAPAEQMQFDWAHYTVSIGDELVKIYIHQSILGYSRLKVFTATLSMTQSDVFNALEESFIFFGGVCERLQVDNAKVFVDNASRDNFTWNKRFLHFCGFYGIKPTRSLPSHPWSKGKVEKPFSYLENHFIAGNEFKSFTDLQQRLKQFQNETNSLLHHTTKEITKVRFETKEQLYLNPLPINQKTGEIRRYIGFKEEFRKVTKDSLISYKGNKYSVPHYFAGKEVWIKVIYGTTLQIFSSKNKLIASHNICLSKKGEVVIDKEHYKGYRTDGFDTIAKSVSRLKTRFANYVKVDQFIENVKVQRRINVSDHLYKIANLFEYYNDKDCIVAMDECFNLNIFNATIIKGFLTNQAVVKEDDINLFNINLPKGDVKRDLKDYKL